MVWPSTPVRPGRAEELRPGLPPDALWLTLGPQGLAGGRSLEDAAKGAADREPAVRVKEEDVAFILFTGGTTGASKGVMLTHRNLIWNAINVIAENRSPGPEAVVCYPMQIYHSGALSRFLATLFAGGSFLAMAGFDPEAYLDALQDQGGTFVAGNQAIWHLLLEGPNAKSRGIWPASAPGCTPRATYRRRCTAGSAPSCFPGGRCTPAMPSPRPGPA